jgi:hypothetical protein
MEVNADPKAANFGPMLGKAQLPIPLQIFTQCIGKQPVNDRFQLFRIQDLSLNRTDFSINTKYRSHIHDQMNIARMEPPGGLQNFVN